MLALVLDYERIGSGLKVNLGTTNAKGASDPRVQVEVGFRFWTPRGPSHTY
jgi:hypothetical protein